MRKSPQTVRAVLLLGAGILLILLIGSLIRYESVVNSILHWIEELKTKQ